MRIHYCSVSGCGSKSHILRQLKYHCFPRRGSSFLYVVDSSGTETYTDRKDVWEKILLMKKPAGVHHRVCSLHFQASDYYYPDTNCSFAKLHNSAIPTLNLPQIEEGPVVCMVETCGNRSDANGDKQFFSVCTPVTDAQSYKWNLWREALGQWNNVDFSSDITVCSDHFVYGCCSGNPKSVDYVPSQKLNNCKIEEVTVRDSYIMTVEGTNEDPLMLAEPEFVSVDGGLEDVKMEPEEC